MFSTFLKINKSREQFLLRLTLFLPYLRLTVKNFQLLRLSAKFLAVLHLSVNPIRTLYFIYVRKIYQRSHGKITRQWKSTLTDLINREGVVYSVRAVGRSVVSLPASRSLHRRQRRAAVKDCVFNLILFADKLYSISELFVSLCFESRSRKYLMLSFNEKAAAIWFKYTKRGIGFLRTVLWVLLLS